MTIHISSCNLAIGKNLSFYFHIIEIKDPNNDMMNTVTVTVDHSIQGHELYNNIINK